MTKHRLFLSVLLVASILMLGEAYAGINKIYFGSSLGLKLDQPAIFATNKIQNLLDHKALRQTSSFSGALGIRLTPRIRVEGETVVKKTAFGSVGGGKFDKAHMNTQLYMANIRYDLGASSRVSRKMPGTIKPFVMAGAGLARNDSQLTDSAGFITNSGDPNSGFAWQFGGGLQYDINQRLSFSGAYRYLDAAGLSFDSQSIDLDDHAFRFGLTYAIPHD